MRRFNITVNGTAYDVAVEELDGVAQATPVVAAPVAIPAPVAASAPVVTAPAATPAPAPTAPVVEGGTPINSPMPGNILDVKVTVGQKVAKGDVLVILEAMKMENEILSPIEATVASISVTRGQTVNTNELLLKIK